MTDVLLTDQSTDEPKALPEVSGRNSLTHGRLAGRRPGTREVTQHVEVDPLVGVEPASRCEAG